MGLTVFWFASRGSAVRVRSSPLPASFALTEPATARGPENACPTYPERIAVGLIVCPMAGETGSNEGGVKGSHITAGTRVLLAFALGVLAFGISSIFMPWQVAT